MTATSLLLGLWIALPASASSHWSRRHPVHASSELHLKGIDLYRSSAITLEVVQSKLGAQLERYADLRQGGRHSQEAAARLKPQIEASLRRMAHLAYADLYYADYVTSAERSSYITLDVVDAQDAKARMPFRPKPAGRAGDPAGLLAAWRSYSVLGKTLIARGQLEMTERPQCLAFFCLWGSATPELASYEQRFLAQAPGQEGALMRVVSSDSSPEHRVDALYVLSYLQDGDKVAKIMQAELSDPDIDVRGAALQVLADVATYHKNVFIDVSRIVPLLDFPSTADRTRALAVLVGLADNDRYKPYITSHAAQSTVRLLRLSQPNNQDLAFTLLSMLAPQPYDRHDYGAWETWAASQAPAAPAAADGH